MKKCQKMTLRTNPIEVTEAATVSNCSRMEDDKDLNPDTNDSNSISRDKKPPSKPESIHSIQRNLTSSMRRAAREVRGSFKPVNCPPYVDVPFCKVRAQNKPADYMECAKCGKVADCSQVHSAQNHPRLDPALEASQTSTCHSKVQRKVTAKIKKLRALRERKVHNKSENKGSCKTECKGATKKDQAASKKSQPKGKKADQAWKSSSPKQSTSSPKRLTPSSKQSTPSPLQLTPSPTVSDEEEEEGAANTELTTDFSDDEYGLADGEQNQNAVALCGPNPINETAKKIMMPWLKTEHAEDDGADDHLVLSEEFFRKCNLQDLNLKINPSSVTMEKVLFSTRGNGISSDDVGEDFSDSSDSIYSLEYVPDVPDYVPPYEEPADGAEEQEEDRYLRYQRLQIVTHLQAVHMIYSEIRRDKRMKYLEELMMNELE